MLRLVITAGISDLLNFTGKSDATTPTIHTFKLTIQHIIKKHEKMQIRRISDVNFNALVLELKQYELKSFD